MTQGSMSVDVSALQPWLIGKVALYLGRAQEDIDPMSPLADQGMDSVYALSLCGDIEDELNLEVEPTLAWDHPSIAAIAGHLSDRLSAKAATVE